MRKSKDVMSMTDEEYEDYVITDNNGFEPSSIEEMMRLLDFIDEDDDFLYGID